MNPSRTPARTVIVGGSSSIGRDVIRAFMERGDDVLVTWSKNPVRESGVQSARLELDKRRSVDNFLKTAIKSFGPIDHVVLLAGLLPGSDLEGYSWELMERVVAVNFTGQVYLIRGLVRHMRRGGSILCLSSIAAERGSFDPLYAGSKAAIIAMAKSLATWRGTHLRFNCVTPGLIEDSQIYENMVPARRKIHRKAVPGGHLLKSADLAVVLRDLTENHWSHLNGAVIRLNGGAYV